MKKETTISSTSNSKGAAIFKKILDDKNAIHQQVQNGTPFSEIKKTFRVAKPISATGK